jgi:hypothetical protein
MDLFRRLRPLHRWLATWGWVHLILGSIMALTGLGLFAGSSGARWEA